MKKRGLLVLLVSLFSVCLLFAFAACGTGGGQGGEEMGNTEKTAGTNGLEYTLSDDGSYICSGIGTATQANLEVASWYNNKWVTSIGLNAFKDCTELKSVTIPNSVTSIEGHAFEGCSALKSIAIPASVTSIGEAAFSQCAYLSKVSITELAAWCGISFGDAFANPLCYAGNLYLNGGLVTELVIPDSVTELGSYAFYGCTGLISVTIPASVTRIGGSSFGECNKLVEVCNLSGLTVTAGSTQNGFVAQLALNVYTAASGESKLNTTDDGYIFYVDGETAFLMGDTGTQASLTLPDTYNGRNYAVYRYAFSQRADLTSVTVGSGVEEIGEYAFNVCTGLQSVTIGEGVEEIGKYAFYSCMGLKSLMLGSGVREIGEHAFGYCMGLTGVVIPDGVTTLGSYVFFCCTGLTTVTIPDSVTEIGRAAFQLCAGLTSVSFRNTNGWQIFDSPDETNGTSIDVSTPATAAEYLTSTYNQAYWRRSV